MLKIAIPSQGFSPLPSEKSDRRSLALALLISPVSSRSETVRQRSIFELSAETAAFADWLSERADSNPRDPSGFAGDVCGELLIFHRNQQFAIHGFEKLFYKVLHVTRLESRGRSLTQAYLESQKQRLEQYASPLLERRPDQSAVLVTTRSGRRNQLGVCSQCFSIIGASDFQ